MGNAVRGGVSAPPYPHLHSGPVLVCGSAGCLGDDVERARTLYPDVPAIAVNGASKLVRAFALFSQHPREFPRWIPLQQRLHDAFTVHAAGKAHLKTKLGVTPPMPWVDHWWSGVASGGTSAWGARRLAKFMGFDLVILCGAPLEAGDYFYGFGSKSNRNKATMRHYREQVMADTVMHDGVRSMSGWTARFFGAP